MYIIQGQLFGSDIIAVHGMDSKYTIVIIVNNYSYLLNVFIPIM